MAVRTSKLFLPLSPKPAPRPRFTCRGRFAQAYEEKAYKDWKAEAVQLLADYRPFTNAQPSEDDVHISVEIVVAKPKATKKRRPSGDLDNYEKGVYDAITQTGGFWEDDDQIVRSETRKRWALADEAPGYHLTVTFCGG